MLNVVLRAQGKGYQIENEFHTKEWSVEMVNMWVKKEALIL